MIQLGRVLVAAHNTAREESWWQHIIQLGRVLVAAHDS